MENIISIKNVDIRKTAIGAVAKVRTHKVCKDYVTYTYK